MAAGLWRIVTLGTTFDAEFFFGRHELGKRSRFAKTGDRSSMEKKDLAEWNKSGF
jgi:hypothetical protein